MLFTPNNGKFAEFSLSESIYGACNFELRGDSGVCRMHRRAVEVVPLTDRGVVVKQGTHPIIVSLNNGLTKCCVLPGALKLDGDFLRAAVDMKIPGFAYLHLRGLSAARRWETGAVVGPAALGDGYCYVIIFRPGFRMRVARLLGAFPLVTEMLTLLRLAGDFLVCAKFVFTGRGVVHCVPGGRPVHVRELVSELLGYVERDPGVRVGGEFGEVVRGPCSRCGFPSVVVEGHEARCRVPVVVNPADKLVGDALHALDVRTTVVDTLPIGSKYTVVANTYVSAAAQRKWMVEFRSELVTGDMSDHVVGDLFEARYRHDEQLRCEYLRWLRRAIRSDYGELAVDERHVSVRDGACREQDRVVTWIPAVGFMAGVVLTSFAVFVFAFVLRFSDG